MNLKTFTMEVKQAKFLFLTQNEGKRISGFIWIKRELWSYSI